MKFFSKNRNWKKDLIGKREREREREKERERERKKEKERERERKREKDIERKSDREKKTEKGIIKNFHLLCNSTSISRHFTSYVRLVKRN